MVNKGSIRGTNKTKFDKCVELRKQGLSYSEIRKIVPVAKSTLQNWLTFAGLTLTNEHLQIQLKKSLENRHTATEASKITRALKAKNAIDVFLEKYTPYLNDPFFVSGIVLYESEGAKEGNCRFSNSDPRLLKIFAAFLEKYFNLSRTKDMNFRLYIHITREKNLDDIKKSWSETLLIPSEDIKVTWKRNIVTYHKKNDDYLGQILLTVIGVPYLTRKLLALSGIILDRYCEIV